jgi:hypothetical protein
VGGLPDLAKWETFVEGVVVHYKNEVKYWEIWNEPQWGFSAEFGDFYPRLLERGISAVHRADPGAQVVGLGGVYTLSWATNALAHVASNSLASLNSVSTHIYPKIPSSDYVAFRQNIRDVYGLEIWNTEAGIWDRGFYAGENSGFIQTRYTSSQKAAERYDVGHRGSAELLAHGFLNSIGNGLTKFFYYDGRIHVGPAFGYSHSTLFEYDDTIRAKGVVYAVLARLFDHSVGLGNISPNASSEMYLLNRGGTPLVGLWSLDRMNRLLTLNLDSTSYKVYDLMGNPLNLVNGAIPYGAAPVYLEGQGISVSTLQTAVQSGSVITQPDTTAPNLSLVVFPTGPTQDNPVKFRWLAIDETSSNTLEGEPPQVIQYSYYLQGYDAGWSPWSAGTFVDYNQVPAGAYDFQVRARDAAGNVSGTNLVRIVVEEPALKPLGLTASLSEGIFVIRVSGGTGEGFIVVESSNDFVHWIPVHTNSATIGPFEFTRPADGTPPQFYRAKQQP